MQKRKKFGEILVEAGILSEATLQAALARQKITGKRLGQILEEGGKISEKVIAVVLARQFGLKTVKNLAARSYPAELLNLVERSKALENQIFPLRREQMTLHLAMTNPLDMAAMDVVSFRTGLKIVPHVTTPSEILAAIQAHYLGGGPYSTSGNWKLLIVDDQEFFRAAARATLDKQGYDTILAGSGAEALQLAREHAPHLILLDTVMPRMDGYQTFESLQSFRQTRSIPVIAFTSRASAEEEALALDLGYFDFLAKPFNPVRLAARVKRALQISYPAQPATSARQSTPRHLAPGSALAREVPALV